jgi:hypothetical protein
MNRGQNGKLQDTCGDTLRLAKLRHEIGELSKRQCGMMLDPPHLCAGGQELVEMTAPHRRARALLPNRRWT